LNSLAYEERNKSLMKIEEHIGKITWSFLDKMIFIMYGLITLLQMRFLQADDLAMYAMLIAVNTWIYIVTDTFSLSIIIQYGMKETNRRKANTIALIFHIGIVMGISLLIYLLHEPISSLFEIERGKEMFSALPILSLLMLPRTYALKFLYRDFRFNQVFWINFFFMGTMAAVTFYYISEGNLDFSKMMNLYYAGAILSSAYGVIIARKNFEFGFSGDLTLRQVFRFVIPATIQSATNALIKTLDVYVIKFAFRMETVAVYVAAKTLFRVFDEAGNASLGLIYPSAVKQINNNNKQALSDLITKAVSFMLMVFIAMIIILELGFAEFLVKLFLPERFFNAISMFQLMLLAALAIPFIILSSLINASGKPERVLYSALISMVIALAIFSGIAYTGNEQLIPLMLVAYYLSFGLLCYLYVKKHFGFPVKMLFRAIPDSLYFIRKKIYKKI
jgi:O-antigen/teichoic acid export membrane protein